MNGKITGWLNGEYSPGYNLFSINQLSPEYRNFYRMVNTSTHEYGGHGYQDLVLENKSSYLEQNPQFSTMVGFFEFNNDYKIRAQMGGIKYGDSTDFGIYWHKPTEKDARYIGEGVQDNLTTNHN